MRVAWVLTRAYILRHPVRMLLTALAVVASACMVVWVVSGYDALLRQYGQQAAEYVGRYDFFVVPEDPHNPSLDPRLADALREDPAVAEVTPVVQLPSRLLNPAAGPSEPGGMGGLGGGPRGGGVASPSRGPSAKGGSAEVSSSRTSKSAPGRPGPTGGPPGFPGSRGAGGAIALVGSDAAHPPHAVVEGTWIDTHHPEQRGAVIGKATAEQLGLKLGDDALVILGKKEFRLHIVGLIDEGPSRTMLGRRMVSSTPAQLPTGLEAGPAASAVYVPLALAVQFSRGEAKVNLINIQLQREAPGQLAQFRKQWEPRIAASRPVASMLGVDDITAGLEAGMMGARARQEAWAAAGLALLAALFIIFGTLSMGVTERTRQFGMLRAIGLTRGQLAWVIAGEGIFLALIGWGGGLLAGWGLLAIVSRAENGLFQRGAALGAWCVILSGLSALGGSLTASLLPAWGAMRLRPLEAISPRRSLRPHWAWTSALAAVGLLLIAVNPILVYVAASRLSSDLLYASYAAIGCSTMAIGFLLLTPVTIVIAETVISPLLAKLLRLDPRLLRSQLASNLWRTLGTTAALTVGLGLFVSLQIWGHSMLYPFKPGQWLPDALIAIQRGGLPDAEVEAVRGIEGVRADQCLPLAVEQPKLAADITDSATQTSVIRQNNVIMIGIDPPRAFGGTDPLLKLRFVEGRPEEAVLKLKQGRNCLVPDHFLRATHLRLGDRFTVIPPESPDKRLEYTIVGAVSLPGWHWMTKFSGLRRRDDRAAAMIFADFNTVRRDFRLDQINFFWMNVDPAVGARYLDEARQIAADQQAAAPGAPAANVQVPVDARRAAVIKVAQAMRAIADRHPGDPQPVNAQGLWSYSATMFGPSVRVSTPAEAQAFITARAAGMIWASCYLPLITLLVTSLGVVNTVMASVRARRWEFGVLRSQGITRFDLFRMILAEGLLIGVITCLMSLGFGLLSGWCGTGISQYVSFFGGLAPPLVVPWRPLSFGFGMAIALCLLAALWPAWSTGRAEPLRLLQEGRAAM